MIGTIESGLGAADSDGGHFCAHDGGAECAQDLLVTRRFDVTRVLYSLTSLVTSRPTVRMGLGTKPTVEIQIGINTGGERPSSRSTVRTNWCHSCPKSQCNSSSPDTQPSNIAGPCLRRQCVSTVIRLSVYRVRLSLVVTF